MLVSNAEAHVVHVDVWNVADLLMCAHSMVGGRSDQPATEASAVACRAVWSPPAQHSHLCGALFWCILVRNVSQGHLHVNDCRQLSAVTITVDCFVCPLKCLQCRIIAPVWLPITALIIISYWRRITSMVPTDS